MADLVEKLKTLAECELAQGNERLGRWAEEAVVEIERLRAERGKYRDKALWAAEILDHWADREDARAIICPVDTVSAHRECEKMYRDLAKWFREMRGE